MVGEILALCRGLPVAAEASPADQANRFTEVANRLVEAVSAVGERGSRHLQYLALWRNGLTAVLLAFPLLWLLASCRKETTPAAPTGQTVTAATGEETPEKYVITGVVLDTEARAVCGARISAIGSHGGKVRPLSPPDGRAVSDEEGRFALTYHGDEHVTLDGIRAEQPGFICGAVNQAFTLKKGDTSDVRFVLVRGEALAGQVSWPLTAFERQAGVTAGERRFALRVQGDAFPIASYLTEPGGAFEIYVPPGTYTIEVTSCPPPCPKVGGIRAGTRNIMIGPPATVVSPEVFGTAFDTIWKDMDENYSYFWLKKNVDWSKLAAQYRPRAVAAATVKEFAGILKEMLTELNDPHIWIEADGDVLATCQSQFRRNWSPQAMTAIMKTRTEIGPLAIAGRTQPDGFGFLILNRQSAATAENVRQTVEAIRALRDVPAFIVDLRGGASGGNELLARQIAQEFCEKQVVYAKSKYRSGAGHEAFGPVGDRVLEPGASPFAKPVVCLIGSKCMSSGEGFVQMMAALPQVTTVGEPTRGASGNPQPRVLPGIPVTVWYSRWVDMMPDGSTFEGRGISPDITITAPVEAYTNRDPTLERALDVLRQQIAVGHKVDHRE